MCIITTIVHGCGHNRDETVLQRCPLTTQNHVSRTEATKDGLSPCTFKGHRFARVEDFCKTCLALTPAASPIEKEEEIEEEEIAREHIKEVVTDEGNPHSKEAGARPSAGKAPASSGDYLVVGGTPTIGDGDFKGFACGHFNYCVPAVYNAHGIRITPPAQNANSKGRMGKYEEAPHELCAACWRCLWAICQTESERRHALKHEADNCGCGAVITIEEKRLAVQKALYDHAPHGVEASQVAAGRSAEEIRIRGVLMAKLAIHQWNISMREITPESIKDIWELTEYDPKLKEDAAGMLNAILTPPQAPLNNNGGAGTSVPQASDHYHGLRLYATTVPTTPCAAALNPTPNITPPYVAGQAASAQAPASNAQSPTPYAPGAPPPPAPGPQYIQLVQHSAPVLPAQIHILGQARQNRALRRRQNRLCRALEAQAFTPPPEPVHGIIPNPPYHEIPGYRQMVNFWQARAAHHVMQQALLHGGGGGGGGGGGSVVAQYSAPDLLPTGLSAHTYNGYPPQYGNNNSYYIPQQIHVPAQTQSQTQRQTRPQHSNTILAQTAAPASVLPAMPVKSTSTKKRADPATTTLVLRPTPVLADGRENHLPAARPHLEVESQPDAGSSGSVSIASSIATSSADGAIQIEPAIQPEIAGLTNEDLTAPIDDELQECFATPHAVAQKSFTLRRTASDPQLAMIGM